MIDSYIILSYDIFLHKIYKKDNLYIIASIGNAAEIQKTDNAVELAGYLKNEITDYPIVELLFHHNKLKTSTNKRFKIKKMIKETNDKDITVKILKNYINLLF
jgi:hypothetical protein